MIGYCKIYNIDIMKMNSFISSRFQRKLRKFAEKLIPGSWVLGLGSHVLGLGSWAPPMS